MFSAIRKRLQITPATAIAFLALCFAISGISYAATGGGGGNKTSPTAQTAKKGKSGPRGARGPAGPAGPAGKEGKEGKQGPAGATGAKGETGATGANGSNGSNGASVTTAAFKTDKGGCKEGGVELTSALSGATFVCNGEESTPGEPGKNILSTSFKGGAGEEPAGEPCKKAGGDGVEVESSATKTYVCNGIEGKTGANGKSVTSRAFTGHTEPTSPVDEPCKGTGGTEFIIEGSPTPTFACNGKNGEGGGGEGEKVFPTLPAGKTETGAWTSPVFTQEGQATASISFPIPLLTALVGAEHVLYVPTCEHLTGAALTRCEAIKTTSTGTCKGSADAPTAPEDDLCVYQGATRLDEEPGSSGEPPEIRVSNICSPSGEAIGSTSCAASAGTAGAVMKIKYENEAESPIASVQGTWAVTAPES